MKIMNIICSTPTTYSVCDPVSERGLITFQNCQVRIIITPHVFMLSVSTTQSHSVMLGVQGDQILK